MTAQRRKILAGNWKMHKTQADVRKFALEASATGALAKAAKHTDVDVIIGAPYTVLEACRVALDPMGVITAAQNAHWADSGAYTGEISFAMLQDAGIHCAIIGHSERRQFFGENDESVHAKVAAGLSAGLQIIACLGETLDERESNQTATVLTRQITAIAEAARGQTSGLVVAYEPVWAIGTGKTATPEMAESAHRLIREAIAQTLSDDVAARMPILYGGSCKPSNFSGLLSQPNIDGALVGGASLAASDFSKMAEQIVAAR